MSTGAPPQLAGFILTGGQSSRFGSNKAFALLNGVSLVDRALAALREMGCAPYLVSKIVEPYRELGIPVVDKEGPQRGPVAGWKAGLEASTRDWVFALSVDMPYVSGAVLRALIPGELPTQPQAFCFHSPKGFPQPFPGLYHRDLAHTAADLGMAPSMRELLAKVPVKEVTLPGDPDRVLQNINRPADFS